MKTFDCVVVGAGLAGGIIARELAEKRHKKVLIVERRDHIAGNTYDLEDSHGIKIQKYGPHVLHTNSDEVYNYITRFCEPIPYRTKCEAVIDGVSTPSPFNLKTIDQFYSAKDAADLKERLARCYPGRSFVTVVEMLECSDEKIRNYAQFLFEHDYRPYTAKQWALDPSEIDISVLKRVPIALTYADTYFDDKYEFMPKNGFSELYRQIISYPGITVTLGSDALDHITVDEENSTIQFDGMNVSIVYTGAIDELFQYRFGVLPYRSLYFDFRQLNVDSYQTAAIVAYPQADGYTRITEYTKMPPQDSHGWTCIAYEFPVAYDRNNKLGCEPYYPILTEQSKEIYSRYYEYAGRFKNLTLCGRLAEFKYYNMDQVILRALEISGNMEEV